MRNLEQIDIIKYGTATLTTEGVDGDEMIDVTNMNQHGQIIRNNPTPTLIVSSGAVGFGRTLANGSFDLENEAIDDTTRRRVLATIGQPQLIENWRKALHQPAAPEVLLTYYDLRRKGLATTFKTQLMLGLTPIVNFNDAVDDSELADLGDEAHKFGDNDHLAAEVATKTLDVGSSRLILNSSCDGLEESSSGKIITELALEDLTDKFIADHDKGKTDSGTGGMGNKLRNIRDALKKGVQKVHLINGKVPSELKKTLNGQSTGTVFTQ